MVEKRYRAREGTRNLRVRHPNAAGIDIGSRHHWVAVPDAADGQNVRSFETFTDDLHRLADWLSECGVDTVAMESTGVYWIPVYDLLEQRGFEVLLVNAAHIRNVPGRKTDVRDCQWIQQLHSYGLLRGSFRPNAEILELRAYMRHRDMLVHSAARHIRHMQKALTQMNIQVHHVLSDITGVTGMRIVRALAAGQYDPEVLAQYRDPRCRSSKARIAAALRGTYKPEHIFTLKQALELYDGYKRALAECDQKIEQTLSTLAARAPKPEAPLPAPKQRRKACGNEPTFDIRTPLYRLLGGVDLSQLPGIGQHTALNIVAEIGTDVERWPTADHFAAWLNLAPGSNVTGGKNLSSRRPPAKNRTGQILRQAASSVARTTKALGAFARRLAARTSKGNAVVATARKLGVLIYTLIKHRDQYVDPGAQSYEAMHAQRSLHSLRKRAKHLGYQLVPVQPDTSVT